VACSFSFDTGDKETDFYYIIRVVGLVKFCVLLSINILGIKYVSRAGILFLTIVIMGVEMAFIVIEVNKWNPKI
jgi:hypothetical protein